MRLRPVHPLLYPNVLLLLLLPALALACRGGSGASVASDPESTSTPRPPTATPRPPTSTPEPPAATPAVEEPASTLAPPVEVVVDTPVPPTAVALVPTPTATPPVSPAGDPPPPPAIPEPAPAQVAQGGALVLRITPNGAAGGDATMSGRTYPLAFGASAAGEVLWAVIGLGAFEPLGPHVVAVRVWDAQGVVLREESVSFEVVAAGYPVEQITLSPGNVSILTPEAAAMEADLRASVFGGFTPEKLWSGLFILPTGGSITSPYGSGRSYNGAPVTSYHTGADFGAAPGTPIVAANAGRVAYVGELPIRGISVFIDHGLGVFSAYHHMSQAAAVQGQFVSQGEVIGYVGETGLAEGAHLHWEIAVRGVNVDPVLWTQVEFAP